MELNGVRAFFSERFFCFSDKANKQQQRAAEPRLPQEDSAEPFSHLLASPASCLCTCGRLAEQGSSSPREDTSRRDVQMGTPGRCRQKRGLPCPGKAVCAGRAEDEEESREEAADAAHVLSLLRHLGLCGTTEVRSLVGSAGSYRMSHPSVGNPATERRAVRICGVRPQLLTPDGAVGTGPAPAPGVRGTVPGVHRPSEGSARGWGRSTLAGNRAG